MNSEQPRPGCFGCLRIIAVSDLLRFEDINAGHPEGQKLRASAERILTELNASGAKEISLNQVRDLQTIIAGSVNNGDGVITPEAADDPDLARFIVTVMETIGSAADASGKPGISEEQLKTFLKEAEDHLAWKSRGEIPKGKDTTEIMFWGAATPQAYELVISLEDKIEQYFTQCAMVRFDERVAAQMKLQDKELAEMDFTDKEAMETRLKNGPLAPPNVGGILNLKGVINPLYVKRFSELKEKVLRRAAVKELTREQWDKVKTIFAPYRAWIENKQGIRVEKLAADKLRTYIEGSYSKRVGKLIVKDLAVAEKLKDIHNVEKLILYQRWLMELANNFVSFANFYNPAVRSLFEEGTLIIDGREMTFTMRLQDREAHKKIAAGSYMYLLYVEITSHRGENIKFEIVTAVTSGDAGRLHIGKRGIFFSRDGQEWDAQVVDIVANPISILESIKAPFLQFASFIRNQIDKFGKSRQTKAGAAPLTTGSSSMARDLILGGSIAIAALGSSFAYITKTLSQVKPVHGMIAFAGIIVLILLPNAIIGFVKLRKRDLSAILEAAGCAINLHMRLGANLGRLFTHLPRLPEGSRKQRRDLVAGFVRKLGYSSYSLKRLLIIAFVTFLITFGIIHLLTRCLVSR